MTNYRSELQKLIASFDERYELLGPFETNLQARRWASDCTNPEFITSIRILPIYEVL